MNKIKVIQIGMGHDHAVPVFDSLLSQPDQFEVLCLARPEEEADRFADRYETFAKRGIPVCSVAEALALDGIAAAVIETEEKNLCRYALIAAEQGLPLHMDKPGGFDLAEFEALAETVKEKHLPFTLGYMYRFNPILNRTIDKIRRGELGKIYSIETHMNCEHNGEKRKWMSELPGGMMFFLGCHLVDVICRIQGFPEKVTAINPTDDCGFAVLHYPEGISFVKASAYEAGGFHRRQIVIVGEKGTVEICPIEEFSPERNSRLDLTTSVRETPAVLDWNAHGEWEKSECFNRYDNMMLHFADMVNGTIPYDSVDYEVELYKVLQKACGKS